VPGNVFDSTMVVTGAQVEVVGGGDDARLEHSYGCEKARVALSSDWTSSLLPTKSPTHLDAVGDNLGLPAEPATATLCARPRQDLHRKPVSRSGIWRRESRAFAVWCAKAGSVRPANHRPGRLPEGRTEGPSLEPGWRSTVRRTADPSVSFAERGAVSEGIQIPAFPRCRTYGPVLAEEDSRRATVAPTSQVYHSETLSTVAIRQRMDPSMGCRASQLSAEPSGGRQVARTSISRPVLSTPATASSVVHSS